MNGEVINPASTRYVWYVVGLLSIVNVFSYMDRMALAALVPYIKADLRLSDAELGLLTGLAFSLFYAVCGIPIARLADRGVRRNIISLAILTWSAATAFCGAAHGFWQLLAARVGIGAGEAGCLPPSQSLICDYVPLQRRAGIFALHNLGNYVGMVAGLMLAGGLVERFGWRWTFVAIGMPGLVLALIVRVTLQEPQRGRFESVHSKSAYLSLTATVGRLWRCRTYRLMVCFYAINGFVQYGLGQWWPSFYLREFPVGMSRIGIYLGLGIGVGSMVGSLAGGLLANAMRTSLRRPLVVGAVATLVAAPTVLLSLFIGSFTGSVLLVAVTAALWSMSNGPIIATVNSVVSSSVRATAASITVFSASVLGFGLGPLCVGIFSDSLADSLGNQALRYAMLVPVSLLPVMSFVLYRASTTVSDDLDGAEDGIGQTEADYGVRV